MPTFKPCRVTFKGYRYQIEADGSARNITAYIQMNQLDRSPESFKYQEVVELIPLERQDVAREVRQEAARQRRNRAARERNSAMRSLGMKCTSYGWE